MSGKERLDIEMLSRKLVESRAQAKTLIEEGRVTVDGRVADKAGRIVCASSRISVSEPLRFVSRGGLKLLAAIEQFRVSFDNCSVLDVGASTGGFTDCVLQFGARHVTCVDVGRDQLHYRLRTD
ncbi:MAG: SAM-dependent methyltransferase, partial [Planctomycetota bacterium]